ncbi:cysteine desulfurase family protein [Bacillus sp. B15-48]|uniref:cysteine desulfurase family protein n=1 Tax=Bacillus sp. B15-48 TaxID=1548601 RepID=UPI001940012D|nr:cysteine desulfurase family protein [Bacillus sp. B15-48]MBM4763002.1 aminotransferase class V-fold PLP-dependent enzyme [Bacillus sp. B15-48]
MPAIYFDNSATTKPYPEVTNKVVKMLTNTYGNPSSLHRLGKESKMEIETARQIIADSLDVNSDEIYFTSGGTEANNLAIKGACLANSQHGNHIVTTAAEHPAVTKAIRDLKKQGWIVTYIEAPNGELDIEALEHAVNEKTVLVSAMLVNNEIGSIFPIEKIKQIIQQKQSPAIVHCDAVQGYGKLHFTAASLGADLISISAHKIHGPKGVGALYVKKGIKMFSMNLGGGQERGLRSGTENTPFIAAFGEAVRITFANRKKDVAHMITLRDYCLEAITRSIPEVMIHSSQQGAPHIAHFSLPGVHNKKVIEFLDSMNIYISSAAACKSNHSRGPSVLESLGLSRSIAECALRVSFSYMNTKKEIDLFVETLVDYYRQEHIGIKQKPYE